jgi:hypothetical protein
MENITLDGNTGKTQVVCGLNQIIIHQMKIPGNNKVSKTP